MDGTASNNEYLARNTAREPRARSRQQGPPQSAVSLASGRRRLESTAICNRARIECHARALRDGLFRFPWQPYLFQTAITCTSSCLTFTKFFEHRLICQL